MRTITTKSAIASLLAMLAMALGAPMASADFGISAFDGSVTDGAGNSYSQAAGHPSDASTSFTLNEALNSEGSVVPDGGGLKSVHVELPPGLIGNPNAAPSCAAVDLVDEIELADACPIDSIVGIALLRVDIFGSVETQVAPVINVEPPPGVAAEFAFQVQHFATVLDASLRSDGDYGIDLDVKYANQGLTILGSTVTLWGNPTDETHDDQRCLVYPLSAEFLELIFGEIKCIGPPGTGGGPNSADFQARALITNPSACTDPGVGVETRMTVGSWNPSSAPDSAAFQSHDPPGFTVLDPLPPNEWGPVQGPSGCEAVPFEPEVSISASTARADSPTGLDVDIAVPTEGLEDPTLIAQSNLKQAVVTLPEGMTVNPASAGGLGSCSPQQLAAETASSDPGEGCPLSSKIGSVEVDTPLLEESLEGSVFLAKPNDNPFNSLLALYIVVKSPERGVVIRLSGRVAPDPNTGRLVTTFDDNPQLPFSSLHLELKSGSRAPLVTPPTCGMHESAIVLSPWARPTEPVSLDAGIQITTGPDGAPCPAPDQFDPGFEAGTLTPIAGEYSPLIVNATRPDGSGPLTGISIDLPEGLLGKLAGVESCSDASLAAAAGKSGGAESASPSCPAASKVGSVDVGAGAGSLPFHVQGSAYLAGPYKGAPLSVAVITPAVAGPFDLGTVVTRAAAQIDPVTTQLRVTSDPIPRILEGIPLKVRSISVDTSRPEFTLNPTDCDPMSVGGTLFSPAAQAAAASRFQVGACKALGFKPKLTLSLKGKVHRRAHPSLRATLVARPGDANIGRAQVKLPKSAFLDNAHITGICTRVQFAASACPKGSIYGKATATSPLLDYTVAGPVYLRANPAHKLPDLVVAFQGPAHQPIAVELAGKTDSVKGALRNTFLAVPDVPVEKFSLTLFGGKKGLVEMSSGFCSNPKATIKLDAQSGATYDTRPTVRSSCRR